MIRALIFCLCCLSTAVMTASGAESPSQKSPTSQVCMEQKLGSLPLYFIENQGQVDSDEAAFYIKGDDKTLYFTSSGLTIAMVQSLVSLDGIPDVKGHQSSPLQCLFYGRQHIVHC